MFYKSNFDLLHLYVLKNIQELLTLSFDILRLTFLTLFSCNCFCRWRNNFFRFALCSSYKDGFLDGRAFALLRFLSTLAGNRFCFTWVKLKSIREYIECLDL